MSNHHLRDDKLSLKAKGLLSLMLSLPENRDYTTKGLAHICKDGYIKYRIPFHGKEPNKTVSADTVEIYLQIINENINSQCEKINGVSILHRKPLKPQWFQGFFETVKKPRRVRCVSSE